MSMMGIVCHGIWGFYAPSFRFAFLQLMEPDTWEMFGQSNHACFIHEACFEKNTFAVVKTSSACVWGWMFQSWHIVKSRKATCAHQHNMKLAPACLFECWNITVMSGDDRQVGFWNMSLITEPSCSIWVPTVTCAKDEWKLACKETKGLYFPSESWYGS